MGTVNIAGWLGGWLGISVHALQAFWKGKQGTARRPWSPCPRQAVHLGEEHSVVQSVVSIPGSKDKQLKPE